MLKASPAQLYSLAQFLDFSLLLHSCSPLCITLKCIDSDYIPLLSRPHPASSQLFCAKTKAKSSIQEFITSWKETRGYHVLKLDLLQYKCHLENNTLQANNCQAGWTDLLKYVEINLALTLWCPWRLGSSAFRCPSLSQPQDQPSLCSHFWRKRLYLAGRARARARQAGSLSPCSPLLIGQMGSGTLSSAIKARCPTLVTEHFLSMNDHFR